MTFFLKVISPTYFFWILFPMIILKCLFKTKVSFFKIFKVYKVQLINSYISL